MIVQPVLTSAVRLQTSLKLSAFPTPNFGFSLDSETSFHGVLEN